MKWGAEPASVRNRVAVSVGVTGRATALRRLISRSIPCTIRVDVINRVTGGDKWGWGLGSHSDLVGLGPGSRAGDRS